MRDSKEDQTTSQKSSRNTGPGESLVTRTYNRGRTALDEVARTVEVEEARFYEEAPGSHDKDSEAEFVGAAPPELLTEPVTTVADLESLLGRLDSRWRLDALVALDDYLS